MKRKCLRTRLRPLDAACCSTMFILGLLYVALLRRPGQRPQRRLLLRRRDHGRARVLPVLHLGQDRADGLGRQGRRAATRRRSCTTMVERLAAMADLPKPRVAVIPTDGAERVCDRPEPKKHSVVAVTEGLWNRLEPHGDRGRPRARAHAHREPRRRRDDDRELLLHGRCACSRASASGAGCSAAATVTGAAARPSG